MKFNQWYKRTFNYNTTEKSADTMLLTLIISGWLVSLSVYLMTN